MEKQRNQSVPKSCRRLLNFLIFFTATVFFSQGLFSQTLTAAEISQLSFVPAENQEKFTKTDLKFEVNIPKIKASKIQILSNNLPANVTFKTVRKIQDYENEGTKIEIWYSFEKAGNYQLPPLPLMIQNKKRNIKFQKITVTDDPSKQQPKMVVIFDKGFKVTSSDGANPQTAFSARVGEKLKFTVYLQYSAQLVQFTWDLPKDSIFTQTKTFEITEVKYREKNYSHDLIPVAKFEWTGLKTGIQEMPKIKITATGYNGYRNELLLPAVKINFVVGQANQQNSDDKTFSAAFSQNPREGGGKKSPEITEEICQKLADLYSQERRAVFNYKAIRKERIDLETSLGIPSTTSDDFSMHWLLISIGLAGVFLVFFIICLKKHHFIRILIFGSLLLLAIVSILYSVGVRSHTYGICKGCSISSVPEDSALAVSEIKAGNRVEITEKAGNWYYIELGQIGGWGLKDNIILIK